MYVKRCLINQMIELPLISWTREMGGFPYACRSEAEARRLV